VSQGLPQSSFWRGKRVLVTGHTGFKGGWATLWLSRMGAKVSGLALPPAGKTSFFALVKIDDLIDSQLVDLRDASGVARVVGAAAPEIVLHFAAQPLVRRSIARPIDTIETNVLGTANLLEALRAIDALRTVLIVTSDKVYANSEKGQPFREGDTLGGKDPYSASKAACEIITRSFVQSFLSPRGVVGATARGGNVIGGGDFSEDRILPDAVRAIEEDRPLILRHPEATRPWQHVLDCLAGYLCFCEALDQRRDVPLALNFGPGEEQHVSVRELVEIFHSVMAAKRGWRHEPVAGSIEMKALALDTSLARRTLDWSDRLPGKRAVEWTARWYHQYLAGADMRRVTDDQIVAFEDTVVPAHA
jgi:CDP-glucose 4,6-dehydratase